MNGSKNIGIIGGAGWLGGAIAASLVKTGAIAENELVLSFRSRRPNALSNAFWTSDNQELADRSDVVVISVRPDDWHGLAVDIEDKLLISVMAGISAEALCQRHGTRRVVRAIPNAAAEVALSYTPWIASPEVSEEDKASVRTIFNACGVQDEVENERQIDYLTGLTGTGPAYPALLAFAMLQDARSYGLSEDVAVRAVNGVIIGAGGLLHSRPEHPQETLDAFLEYKGTTAAGLNTMMRRGLVDAVSDGLAAALEKTLSMGERPAE